MNVNALTERKINSKDFIKRLTILNTKNLNIQNYRNFLYTVLSDKYHENTYTNNFSHKSLPNFFLNEKGKKGN